MKVLFWLPRVLALIFAVFLGLFSFDTPLGVGFMIHLLPSFIIIAAALLLWKFDLPAGIAFLVLGAAATFFFHTYRDPVTFFIISGPFFLISVCYLVSYFNDRSHRRPMQA